jgi:LAO/AO transport system kinase
MMIEMNHPGVGEWWPPVMRTVAQKGEGVAELVAKIEAHRDHLAGSGELRKFEENKSAIRFEELLRDQLFARIRERIGESGSLSRTIAAIARREVDPYSAVEAILKQHLPR